MHVRNVMTENPACCTPDTNLQEVARMMVENDCGCVPVVEDQETRKTVGVVTDRDITCRAVAEGKDPTQMTARDVMTDNVVTVTPETDVSDCCNVMEENQVRRVPVVNEQGSCCGMVAQADIARDTSNDKTAQVVERVSKPTQHASGCC